MSDSGTAEVLTPAEYRQAATASVRQVAAGLVANLTRQDPRVARHQMKLTAADWQNPYEALIIDPRTGRETGRVDTALSPVARALGRDFIESPAVQAAIFGFLYPEAEEASLLPAGVEIGFGVKRPDIHYAKAFELLRGYLTPDFGKEPGFVEPAGDVAGLSDVQLLEAFLQRVIYARLRLETARIGPGGKLHTPATPQRRYTMFELAEAIDQKFVDREPAAGQGMTPEWINQIVLNALAQAKKREDHLQLKPEQRKLPESLLITATNPLKPKIPVHDTG